MWNRKRQNLLLVIEIFVAFLIVVGVSVVGLHFGNNSLQPLGFSADGVWTVFVNRAAPQNPSDAQKDADRMIFRHVMQEVHGVPGVEGAAAAFIGPYGWYTWGDSIDLENGPSIVVSGNRADDGFARLLALPLRSGRWFSREDDGVDWEPVVINRNLATRIFGDVDPVGRFIAEAPSAAAVPGESGQARRRRVVGVIDDFRQFGELSTPGPVMFQRMSLDVPVDRLHMPEVVLLKVAPGATAALEETIVRRMRDVAPGWSFSVQPVAAMRESMLRDMMVPLVVVSLIAGALLLMVALGLTGVVWQNVTQRMREFGLRRAHGATAASIGRQVIGELTVMTGFAVVLGCLLLLQIPMLPLPPEINVVPRPIFVLGVLVAAMAIFSVTILCAWYPSRLATRVPPADALHYE
jgi:putative ABC transport system permease protein